MKIADSHSIRSGEQALIATIMEKLDHSSLTELATRNLSAESMEFVNGDMKIMGDRIVYKMDFKVTVGMSVIIDREGNLVGEGCDDVYDALGDSDEGEGDYLDEYDKEMVDEPDENGIADDAVSETGQEVLMEDDNTVSEDMDEIIRNSRDFWEERSRNAEDNRGMDD